MRRVIAILVATLLAGSHGVRAADAQERINRAIERGVQALRQLQQQNGGWGSHRGGSTSLAALALLECGVKPDDPAIQKAATVIRDDAIASDRVYNVSLAILFLDRLGDPIDEPLIQALGVRLMEAQCAAPRFGWSYTTPLPHSDEVTRLTNLRSQANTLKTDGASASETKPVKLDPDLERRLEILERFGPAGRERSTAHLGIAPDNSNSQFAVLGLWVARRHGVPTDAALRRAEYWYRASHIGGTWTYNEGEGPFGRSSTTCAGLLGLAAGAGVARTAVLKTTADGKPAKSMPRHPLEDPLVQTALNFVGLQVAAVGANGIPTESIVERDYYFLWSAERVAMVYGLKKMGTVDWYTVGSTVIVLHQLPEGAWKGRYEPEIDTSFALLFLKRSNFAPDLSAALNTTKETALSAKDATIAIGPAPTGDAAAPGDSAESLARELIAAKPEQVDSLLHRLREAKGGEYTDALARVIPQLVGPTQGKARDALAERLARMTAATLRQKLKDADVELRRAAALACAAKDERALIGDLIATLDDRDSAVVRAAAVALRSLTGENFGPGPNATSEERARAITAWKAWWKRQSP